MFKSRDPIKNVEREVRKMDAILEKLKRVELQEFTNYLHSPWRIFWANFLAGTSRGLGFLFGATVIVALMGFILGKVLGHVPVVGSFFEAMNIWIQNVVETGKQIKTQ